ncbi:tetratricopeptide repeat protein [Cryomorphaceae bacterium 1068]|nr:tetratricopeptide repeat protein [Cryomorphaceae bacterium 1068]
MRTSVLVLLLICFGSTLDAQTNLDSLYSVWQDKNQAEPDRLHAFHEYIRNKYLNSDPDSAFYLAGLQYEFAHSADLQMQKGEALLLQARALNLKGEYTQASEYFDRSMELFTEIGAKDQLAKSFIDKASLYIDLGKYDSAYAYFDMSIATYQELNDSSGVATVLLRKAYTAEISARYTEAMEYAFEALRISEKLKDSVGIADAYVKLSAILYQQKNYEGSIEYGMKALEFLKQTNDRESVADAYLEIGYSYLILGDLDTALTYMNRTLDIRTAIGSSPLSIGSAINGRGNVYKHMGDYDNALADYMRCLEISKAQGSELGIMAPTANIGHVYILMEEYEKSLPYLFTAVEMMEASDNRLNIVENYMHISKAYEELGQFEKSLKWYRKYNTTKDSIFTTQKDHTLSELRTQYETEKKEEQIASLEKKAELEMQAHQRDRLIKILLVVLAVLLVAFAFGLWNRLAFMRNSRGIIQKERDRSETLLLNILPKEVAEELKEKGEAEAQLIDHATVLFSDFKGFTAISEKLSPKELVRDLNDCFSAFDAIMDKYGIEKIKTIGDSYMAAGGLPLPDALHAENVVRAAFEMRDFIRAGKAKKIEAKQPYFEIRIGIHTGPVVAGIVGVKKFQYDIWGDTVNTASRMESSGEVGKVNISQSTYEILKNDSRFEFESRGKIKVKGKGEIDMYFVSKV